MSGILKKHIKNAKNFLREAKYPSRKEFVQLSKVHFGGLFIFGLFAYCIDVINIPFKNFFLGSNK